MDFLYPQNVQQVQRGIISECNCIGTVSDISKATKL
jgi:hypothetical protein